MKKMAQVIIDVSELYKDTDTAKIAQIDSYIKTAQELAGQGNDVVLTGAGPTRLYLKVAHALHGVAKKLIYSSPVTGDVVIFDHSPE